MKYVGIIGAACVAAVISLASTNAHAQYSDNFNGPLDPGWVTDRYAPNSVTTVGGTMNLNISTADSQANRPPAYSDGFYNYQGVQHAVTGIAGDWTATEQIDVTAQMLSGFANGGFWLRTGNGANESTADYDILAFRNPDGNGDASAGFYAWNDVLGTWNFAGAATLGWHTLSMEYTGSAVISKVDGTTVYDNTGLGNPAYDGEVTTVFNEAYNYGDRNYSVSFDNLNVSAPDGGATIGLLAISAAPLAFFMKRRKA